MKKALLALGTLAVAAIAAGIALGAIPGTDGVIHGCFLTRGGTLRVIDATTSSCSSKETSLNWNQTGPKGERGPSDAFTTHFIGSTSIAAGRQETVSSLSLPAGKFVLTGVADVKGDLGAFGYCYFGDPPAELGGYGRFTIANTTPGITSVAATSVVTLAAPTPVDFICMDLADDSTPGLYDAVVTDARLTAVQVATLTEQS